MKTLVLTNDQTKILQRVLRNLTSDTSWLGFEFEKEASSKVYATVTAILAKLKEPAS